MNTGYIKSELTGNEQHFYTTQPVSLQFQHKLSDAVNQGADPICAACAITTFLNWEFPDRGYWDPKELFYRAGGTSEGITFKDILHFLKQKNIIRNYALVHSEMALKTAILLNGPCLGALNIKNSDSCQFWEGNKLVGGHGIAIIGWNRDGFIIRNSWGNDWCNHGNTILPYNRFNMFLEIWTIIA